MLLTASTPRLEDRTLIAAFNDLQGDPPQEIPFLVWLLENPDSPCSLPGSISLADHDRFHCILDRGFSAADEAFIVGFSMGTDLATHWIHVLILKIAAFIFYPNKYQFSFKDMQEFDRGFLLGKSLQVRNLNQGMPLSWDGKSLQVIRRELNLVI